MERFAKNGQQIYPENTFKLDNSKKITPNIVTEAYCPNGCNLIDNDHIINGYPGIKLKFTRLGMEGELVISAIEGDYEKIILSGTLKDGVKDELYCPHCNSMLKKLVNCYCQTDANMVVIGLTQKLDYNNAITFCNVTGCENSTTIKSGIAIRRVRLQGTV
jgi:hypothetical protein